jgi:HK97 family phage prohead protease
MSGSLIRRKQLDVRAQTLAERRQVEFIASNGDLDRERDRIRPSAWRLDNFRKNPVLLWCHDYMKPPLGKVVDIGVRGDALVARAQFLDAGINEHADVAYHLIRAGALNAVSVGFRPLKSSRNEHGGVDYEDCELLEVSIVPVPANAAALITGKRLGAEEFDVTRAEVASTFREIVGEEVRRRLAWRMLPDDAQVIELDDEDALAGLTEADVREALRTVINEQATAAVRRAIATARGRID